MSSGYTVSTTAVKPQVFQRKNGEKMKARKEKLLIPAIAIMMILLFAVLCAAGAFALSSTAEKEGPFERLDYVDESLVTGSIGTLQEAALRRLNAANEEDGGKLTLFSDAQLAKFKAARENGTLEPLSLEDIRFLINDSIVLYNKYDKISIKRLERCRPTDDEEIIIPIRSGLSEKDADNSIETGWVDDFEINMRRNADIAKIILYRLSVIDGGFHAIDLYYNEKADREKVFIDINLLQLFALIDDDGEQTYYELDDTVCARENEPYLEEHYPNEQRDKDVDAPDLRYYNTVAIHLFVPSHEKDCKAAVSEYERFRSMMFWGTGIDGTYELSGELMFVSYHGVSIFKKDPSSQLQLFPIYN